MTVPVHLPHASLERVLSRIKLIWKPGRAPHILLLGQTGCGKSTVVQELLGLHSYERDIVLDPKPTEDHIWDGPADDPRRWGGPITHIPPMLGYGDQEPGGGPCGMRWRLLGSPDRDDTAQRFGAALATITAEGHYRVVLEDYRELCWQLGLLKQVNSLLSLGRSSNLCTVVTATETGWATGRSQAGIVLVGATSGLEAAKAGAALLGKSGRAWWEITAAIEAHQWIYHDNQPGNAGPVLIP